MKIFVAGLINLETTLQIEQFPLEYASVRYPFFGIGSSSSGVGLNVALALKTLGADVHFCSLMGSDMAGQMVQSFVQQDSLALYLEWVPEHPQSVILLDATGQRSIHTDLKDIQERRLNPHQLEVALANVDAAVICNINFARSALQLARDKNIPIYTDLHAIVDLDNPYDQEFLVFATVLFFSAERLENPAAIALESLQRFANIQMVVVGAGVQGAWLFERNQPVHLEPSVPNPNIKSTIGAGDALFSSFVYFHVKTGDARLAIARAVRFASQKLSSVGGASGFISAAQLEA